MIWVGRYCSESKNELVQKMKKGELTPFELLAYKGFNRLSKFTKDRMYTFITLRALSASPLMLEGDLPSLGEFSLKLITNKDVLECNRDGVMGSLIYDKAGIEIWKTHLKNGKGGWFGIFNRNNESKSISLTPADLRLTEAASKKFLDVWNNH